MPGILQFTSRPFALHFAVLSFAAAYLLWPYPISAAALPKWVVQLEAVACGFAAALFISSFDGEEKSTGRAVFAGILTICAALVLTCIVTFASQYLYHKPLALTNASLIELAAQVVTTSLFWILYFVFPVRAHLP